MPSARTTRRHAGGQRHDCFAVCAPGVERLTEGELRQLGCRTSRATSGGVEFSATTRQLYAANAWLRTANRVVVRVARFGAWTFDQLEAAAGDVDLDAFVPPGGAIRLRVTSHSSRLYHTGAIEERLRTSWQRPDEGDLLVVVRVAKDHFTVSVDASGDALHRRGWRLATTKAPLRETLAAAMVLATGWEATTPLVDPFCGSGTIPIEAATIATGHAPGAHRAFAFQGWPSFEPGTWASVRASLEPSSGASSEVPAPWISGSDRDAGAVEAARANAERAGMAGRIEIAHAAVSAIGEQAGDTPGWVVTNPPYGGRVSSAKDLRNLYAAFGNAVRRDLSGWRVGLLAADLRLAHHTGLALEPTLRTTNGGIPVTLLTTPEPVARRS